VDICAGKNNKIFAIVTPLSSETCPFDMHKRKKYQGDVKMIMMMEVKA